MSNSPNISGAGDAFSRLSLAGAWHSEDELRELTERARAAVAQHVADLCAPLKIVAPCDIGPDFDPGQIPLAIDDNVEPASLAEAVSPFHVRSLIETAARAADLPAEDLIDIVRSAAPDAVEALEQARRPGRLRQWADEALTDFQRVPAGRAASLGECTDKQFLADAVMPVLDRGLELPRGLRELGAATAWRCFQEGYGADHPALKQLRGEGAAASVRHLLPRARAMRAAARQAQPIIKAIEWSVEGSDNPAFFDLETEPGLLGDIARWSQEYAFRPVREFAQPAAIAVLAAMFGRRWATPSGLGLNLYLVAIADTGGGKDALIGAPRALLASAGFRHLLGPGDFSSDAAIEKSLRARPSQLMPLDEFGKLAQAMMGRNAPAFAKLAAKSLLEIYPRSQPGSEWTGKARASDDYDAAAEPIYSPTLSLLGVSTPEGFFDGMSQETLNDGFLNRLTVFRAGQAGERQRDAARLIPPPALVDALRVTFEASQASGNLTGATSRDPSAIPTIKHANWADAQAEAALIAVEAWEDKAIDAGRRGVAARAAEQSQKIATLRALSRDPSDPRLTADDIHWAFAMVKASIETIETGAREMMAGSEFEALVQAEERAIIAAGDKGLAWSELLRAKGISKADDRMVEAALKRLESTHRIWRIGPAGKRFRHRRPDERPES